MCNPKSFSGFTIYTVEKKEEKGREGEEEAGRERNTKPEGVEEIDGVSRTNNSHKPSFI